MEITKLKTQSLELDDKFQNKFHSEYLYNKLRVSIQRHGQMSLIHVVEQVDGTYSVVSGSRVTKILKELGVAEALCIIHKNYQDAAMACLSLDSLRFSVDYFKVADQVKSLNTFGINNQRLQHSVSWTKEELDNMLKMSEFDWDKFGEPDENPNQISLF